MAKPNCKPGGKTKMSLCCGRLQTDDALRTQISQNLDHRVITCWCRAGPWLSRR